MSLNNGLLLSRYRKVHFIVFKATSGNNNEDPIQGKKKNDNRLSYLYE
jgi:hypothetical protein